MYITPNEYTRASANGINKARLEHRVRIDGWSVERAIKTPKRHYNRYGNLIDVATEKGIASGTFHSRIAKGWSPEDASSIPIIPHAKRRGAGQWMQKSNSKN